MGIFGGAVLWPTTGPTSLLFSVAPSTRGLRYSFFSLSPMDDWQGFRLYFSKLFPLRTRTVHGTQKVPIKCMWNEWLRAEQGLGLRAPDPSQHPVETFPKTPGYKVPSMSSHLLLSQCLEGGCWSPESLLQNRKLRFSALQVSSKVVRGRLPWGPWRSRPVAEISLLPSLAHGAPSSVHAGGGG